MTFIKHKAGILIFGLLVALAGFIRFYVAPLSSGPDVAQFWAFAEMFRLHGLDFYRYADATSPFFPFNQWAYVYPPLWVIILGLAILIVPGSLASHSMVDPSWRLAAKTPIILADLATGILLYWGIPGSQKRKIILACLWLFNPAAWYNSAVFGQFDAVATAFLIACLILLEKGRYKLAFLLAGLAVLTKQNTLIPLLMIAMVLLRQMPWSKLLKYVAMTAAVIAAFCLPFLFTGNAIEFFKVVVFPAQRAGYQEPIMYAFNGFASLLSYLHLYLKWDTELYFLLFVPVMLLVFILGLIWAYKKRISPLRAGLVGILIFFAFFYRINYQYLVVMIPLALLISALTTYRSEKIFTLVLALFPAVWLWIFDVSFWFRNLEPASQKLDSLLKTIGLNHGSWSDPWDLGYALIFTCLCLAYIALAVWRWHKPLKKLI